MFPFSAATSSACRWPASATGWPTTPRSGTTGAPDTPAPFTRENPALVRRAFRVSDETAPFRSDSMVGFVRAFGAPRILCVWGLGVGAALLDACAGSIKIYNSIDAPALRLPRDIAARFDLVLTAAEWQSEEVMREHPGMACAVLPIGLNSPIPKPSARSAATSPTT